MPVDLTEFVHVETLRNDHDGNFIVLLGHFTSDPENKALLVFTTRPLSCEAEGNENFLQNFKDMKLVLDNESGAEYSYYSTILSPDLLLRNDISVRHSLEVIHPASDRQIRRKRRVDFAQITETPEMYASITAPAIAQSVADGSISWLENVLNGTYEADRVLYTSADPETGCLISINPQWKTHPAMDTDRSTWKNHSCLKDLNVLAISRVELASLRDLRAKHLPLLRVIRDEGLRALNEIYGVQRHQVRVYVHYLPQFYQFHVHFRGLFTDLGAQVDRARNLDDIIQNIEMDGDFYAKRTITFNLQVNDPLFPLLVSNAMEE